MENARIARRRVAVIVNAVKVNAARNGEAQNISHNPIVIVSWPRPEVMAARWRFNETFTQTFGRPDQRPK